MIKAILKIVCVLTIITNAATAQSTDTTIINSVETSIGKVETATLTLDRDFAEVYLEIIDNEENYIYLTATNDDDSFDQLPKISNDLVGKKVKATYTKNVIKEVVKYLPSKLPAGVAFKSPDVDPTITVYTIKGTQEFVEETPEGLEITFHTKSGVEMKFLADSTIFNGHSPINYNGKAIEISYLEFENFNLKELEIIE